MLPKGVVLNHVFNSAAFFCSTFRHCTSYYFFFSAAAMPASAVEIAKGAFVKVLLDLAVTYGVLLACNRDSADAAAL